jgi:hypothetical protein
MDTLIHGRACTQVHGSHPSVLFTVMNAHISFSLLPKSACFAVAHVLLHLQCQSTGIDQTVRRIS